MKEDPIKCFVRDVCRGGVHITIDVLKLLKVPTRTTTFKARLDYIKLG